MLNKIKKIMFFFPLICSFSLEAHSADDRSIVYFIDACTQEPTYVRTPAGIQLKIELNKLLPLSETLLTLEYVPAGLSEDLMKKHRIIHEFYYFSDQRGKLDIVLNPPKNRTLNAVESKTPGYNIWNVNVTWKQTGQSNKTVSGSAHSSIYRMQGTATFFKITTPTRCYWETRPSINSDYYYNDADGVMVIQRKVEYSVASGGAGGFSLGNIPNLGMGNSSNIPLGSSSMSVPALGWFFGEWSSQRFFQHSIEVHRDWSLSKNSGGFFFERYSFYRVQADRYDWVQYPGYCGSYVKTVSGALDIGSRSSEFNSIPYSDSGSPAKVLQFLELYRPTSDSCHDGVHISSRRADYLISSDENNMMFFYPEAPNQNQ